MTGKLATAAENGKRPPACEERPPSRGLYIHVPFCERRCYYCDFNTFLLREGGVEDYLRHLELEMMLYSGGEQLPGERRRPGSADDEGNLEPDLSPPLAGVTFDSAYIGGGTPTALTPSQLERLFAALHRYMPLAPGAEITVEANPGTLSASKLAALRAGGANRISLGAQAAQDHHLQALGRIHRARHVVESVEKARAAGFDNLNLDLMFGLPRQTLAEWEDTLDWAVRLEPEHLSCYSLIVEEETPFGRQHARGELDLPGEDVEADMFERALEFLEARGYRHYEVSNFARPGRESRHNLLYWRNAEWLGLGPGAHSQWKGRRFANVRSLAEYGRRLEQGLLPVEWSERVSRQVAMEDSLILGLRLRDGVDLQDFRRRFGVDALEVFARPLARVQEEGLVEITGDGRLRLTRKGLFLANRVFVELVSTQPTASRDRAG